MKHIGLALAMFAMGCEPSPHVGTDAGPDAEVDAGDEELVELADFLRDNDVVTLELQADGTEYGEGITNPEGTAWFYSPLHAGIFEMGVAEPEADGVLAGRSVRVAVGDEHIAYLITDPMGEYSPLLHTIQLPTEDAVFEVDATDQLVAQAAIEDYDPASEPNPFGATDGDLGRSVQPLTIIGISISLSIRSVLSGIATGAVLSVFKNLVEGACNAVAPLYAERCQLIGNVAGLLGSVVAGIWVAGASAWELGATILDNLLTVLDMNCDRVGGAFVGYVLDPTDTSGRDRYREVARKFNYLLHSMETDPQPGQPSWAQAERMATELIRIRDVARNRHFQLWNMDSLGSNRALGFGLGVAQNATTGFFDNLSAEVRVDVLTRLTITEEMRAYLQIGTYDARYVVEHHRYVQADFDSFEFGVAPSDQFKALNGLIGSCAFNFVQGALVAWSDGTTRNEYELDTSQILHSMLDVFEHGLDATYERHWGAPIPPGTCVIDDYEPNSTWAQAFSSPVPVTLGDPSVVNLGELTLCDALGMSGADDDWYGYYIGPIDFMVAARITNVAGGRGEDERVCIDINFYSEIYEIIGDPPDLITSACGRVGDWPATTPFGVARTTGEAWSMILVRVRHEGGGSMNDVEYGLRFTP